MIRAAALPSHTRAVDSVVGWATRVRLIPELDRERELELARAYKACGDVRAREALLAANLRHVVSIAYGYSRYGVALADLVAEGNVGLVYALGKFDPERGTRFLTYAAYWIRAYVLNHVIKNWSMVGLGSGPLRSKMFFRLRRERARLAAEAGDGAGGDERLAEVFGAPVEKVAALARRLEGRDLSLDVKVWEDGDRTRLDELVAEEPDPEASLEGAERKARLGGAVAEAIAALDARERWIVEVRMLADPDDELSLAEIGRRLGVSRERARQLEERAKRKLRQAVPIREAVA